MFLTFFRTFNVINPTDEGYEFVFELQVAEDNPELIPIHCNMLKGFVEGGTSTEVTFTFSPTAPGVRNRRFQYDRLIKENRSGIVQQCDDSIRIKIYCLFAVCFHGAIVIYTTLNTANQP